MIDNRTTRTKAYEIDISNKYLLTVKEGASYFNIGENKLMSILKSNPDTLLFMNGTKLLKIGLTIHLRAKYEQIVKSSKRVLKSSKLMA